MEKKLPPSELGIKASASRPSECNCVPKEIKLLDELKMIFSDKSYIVALLIKRMNLLHLLHFQTVSGNQALINFLDLQ